MVAIAEIPPVLNQVQFSPFEYRRALLEACEKRSVALEAYSPLEPAGTCRTDRRQIAERAGRTPAQVLLRWCVQRDRRAPEVHPSGPDRGERPAFDFTLSDDDMAALDALDTTGGTDRARERKWW